MHETAREVVVFAGGGTGGHLYPALALAEAVAELRPGVRSVFVGATRGIEARVLPERGLEHVLLPVEGFRRGGGARHLRTLLALSASVVRLRRTFRALRPGAVVVTGGYAGGPAGIVALQRRVPLLLQEQNAVPGLTTRVLARWARRIHVAFPEAVELLPPGARDRARVTGNPVRSASPLSSGEARARFGLSAEATVLLVSGGSQGSLALNRAIEDALDGLARGSLLRPGELRVLWSTGPAHGDRAAAALARAGDPPWVRAFPYIDDMPAALAAADLAVGRAGAMFTAELLVYGVPAVLVPLPSAAADHQRGNALALERAGAALVTPESRLTGATLWARVTELAGDPGRRATMRAAALRTARPHATRVIAEDVVALLRPGGDA